MSNNEHWESVYRSKQDNELSWHQTDTHTSLQLILEVSGGRGRVVDVGGGSSVPIDRLLERRFDRLAVLDIAESALQRSQSRLGEQAPKVKWIVGDVTKINSIGQFDVWHDRAVFHFLTDPQDRESYV